MVAREAHNLEVTGSNPVSAKTQDISYILAVCIKYDTNTTKPIRELITSPEFYSTDGRVAGIEPASSPWQGEIIPFNHTRI